MRLRYSQVAPGGYQALVSLGKYLSQETALEVVLLQLVYVRASQLNGCDYCIGMHTEELRKLGEPDNRIDAVTDWRGSDEFTPRERAALSWTEAVTDVNASHVSDEDYAAAKEFFSDKDLVDLTFAIASVNAWNRMGVAFRAEWPTQPQTGGDGFAPFSASEAEPPEMEAAEGEWDDEEMADDEEAVDE